MTDLISAHIAQLRDDGYADTTITKAEKFLRRLDRELPCGLDKAIEQEIRDWLGGHRLTAQARASYVSHIKRCLRFGADPQRTSGPRLNYDASAGLRRPRVRRGLPRPVKQPHLGRVLTEAAEPFHAAAWAAYRAGLRCCEIVRLDLDSGDVDADRILVHGKGGKEREVPMHPELWDVLRAHRGGPLVRRPDGLPADAEWLSIHAARHFRFDLWLPAGVSMHPLRHTFGTSLVDAGVDIRVIQELLGHDSLLSTAIYTQVTSRQRREAIAALPRRSAPC